MRKLYIYIAFTSLITWSGCGDNSPVSPGHEGDSATPAGKLVVTKSKVAGSCELPPCRPGFGGGGSFVPRPPSSGGIEKTITATLPNGVTMEFVWIPPGTFTMGASASEANPNNMETPQHQVTISQGFYLGKFEITQAQWEAMMGTRPWPTFQVQDSPSNPAPLHWFQVQDLVQAMNDLAGETLYRLPTEAEWEYAARAGTQTKWSFGDNGSQLGDYAWHRGNTRDAGELYAHEVGTKLPNPWGLYDMHGNIAEWVEDWQGAYPNGSQTDPTGPSSGSGRVIRGGFFDSPPEDPSDSRSAARRSDVPTSNSYGIGARLVRIK